jgi:DNA-binding CsgD family transcriptional regulator
MADPSNPSPPEATPPIPPGDIWEALVTEPDTGVSIVDDAWTVVFANEQATRIFLDRSPEEVIGRPLKDLFPPEWVAERIELLQRVARERRPVALRTVWRGKQIRSTIRYLERPGDERDRFLVITRRIAGGEEARVEGYEFVESEVIDLGPLDVLTTRELEVLSLLGCGHTVKKVAAIVRRSPRTVEVHRQSIARKLQEADRVRLARIASEAGLQISDASRQRVRSE